jgi:hypothetical protein
MDQLVSLELGVVEKLLSAVIDGADVLKQGLLLRWKPTYLPLSVGDLVLPVRGRIVKILLTANYVALVGYRVNRGGLLRLESECSPSW